MNAPRPPLPASPPPPRVVCEGRYATSAPHSAGQTRRGSALEAVANVAVGYGIAVATQAAVFPLFGLHASTGDHLAIGAIFTVVSLARSYVLRRIFNRMR